MTLYGAGLRRSEHLMTRNRIRVVDDDNVTVHVSGVVCADLVIQRRAPAFAGTRAADRAAAGVARAPLAS